jgi:subtilase family serine protease
MGVPTATAATHTHHTAAVSKTATSHHISHAKAAARAQQKERNKPVGAVAKTSTVRFNLALAMAHPVAARAFVNSVSTPGSANFHHFLTEKQYVAKYGPSAKAIAKAQAWAKSKGFKVGALPKTHLLLPARGTAGQVEKAFHIQLGRYKVNGHTIRLAKGTSIGIPAGIHGAVTGIAGVNQEIAQTSMTRTPAAAPHAKASDTEPPPPAGFRNGTLCSSYWNQLSDTKDAASLIAPYTDRKYDICGYTPSQLRSAYNVAPSVAKGTDGRGVGIAIVDAYDSPTLLKDAQTYDQKNDPSHVISSNQFIDVNPGTAIDNEDACGASGWYAEQSLDVESSHTMAPGATLVYVGANSCFDSDLETAEQTAVSSGASVVSNSYGDAAGDLLEDSPDRDIWDNTFTLADATGVSVMYSSGDDGDNFADFGLDTPDYPAASPFVTAVGGTSLEVGANGQRAGELGWSTAKQTLCAPVKVTTCGSATAPSGALAWQAGGGGGTSFFYTQPAYQAGIVPDSIAQRNAALFGPQNLRVIPDISMDADAQTGMLIGLTQTFPGGTVYDQFKEGGTSLASPLFAGLVADTDQASGSPLGFLNPLIYKADKEYPDSVNDVVPSANPNADNTIRVDFINSVSPGSGYSISNRVLDYEGPETYCDNTGNCATRPVTLTTAKGYDSLTGLGSAGNNFIAEVSKF